MIVDDMATTRRSIGAMLSEYQVDYAASGEEALTKLCDNELPAVILLDVVMPGMDGFEVCRRIRSNSEWKHIPIIMVTALASTEDVVKGLDAGADEFVNKPITRSLLLARIRSMLRIKQQHDTLLAMLQLREDMANMIVHDMRSPLGVVILNAEMMRNVNDEDRCIKLSGRIISQARYLQGLMDNMLTMAKSNERDLILNLSPVDVNQLVTTIVSEMRILAASNKIELIVQVARIPQLQQLDAILIRRMIENLIDNAIKFSPNDSVVTVTVDYPTATSVCVSVKDQGSGIPVDERERIFERFQIGTSSTNNGMQIGLGLTFCRLVVEAHSGCINVTDNRPNGTIFTIEI